MRKRYAVLDNHGVVSYELTGTEIKSTGDGQVALIDLNPTALVLASEYFYVKAIFHLAPGQSIMEVTDEFPEVPAEATT